MSKGKVVLAYSGGLDTSVAIKWLQEHYDMDVIAVSMDVGEGKDLEFIRQKALKVGAVKSVVLDVRERFAREYLLPALRANALYEGKYPLVSALSRPLIARVLVEVAREEGAVAVAHGCTGKGNDQVRFDVSVSALHPGLKVLAPVREWAMSREEEIAYAKRHGIPIPVDLDNPFSIDQNLWGRSIECGVLEDPWNAPPEEAYEWTKSLQETPDEPAEVTIDFEQGVPVALDGERLPLHELISRLNRIAGEHGVGRIDHVEDRLVGIKSREVYECPAAMTLLAAHRELEFLTQPREMAHFKPVVEQQWARLVYEGLWYSPLKKALDAFVEESQKTVTGTVRVRLFKGHATVTGRKSNHSLYNEKLATYTPEDTFDHQAAVGFIKLWGLPTQVYAQVNRGKEEAGEETVGRKVYQEN
ncbi:MAG: argininosuccinate synthase [Thermoactinomycetaceae bacterium]|nr:argininosuccinate synthase [Bacillota bacterium]MBO2531865.1 argininosuccinate synthase [Thermoactinomycetaceae bacterium]